MKQPESKPKLHKRAKYHLRVCGVVDENWADYFAGMTLKVTADDNQDSETVLIGWLEDQASLLGMLSLLHDWGHALITVQYLPAD